LRERYKGTLFRFPLRTVATANASEIKREAYTPQAVKALFSAFKPQAMQALLFLKHVRKVISSIFNGL
jgi:sacsin